MQDDIRNSSELKEEDADSAAEAAGQTRPPVTNDAIDYAKPPRPRLNPKRKMSWAMHSVRSMQEDLRNISGELSEENEEDTDIDAEEAGNTPAPATESPPQANWNFVKGEIWKEALAKKSISAMKSLKDTNYENARRISWAMKSIQSMQEDIRNMEVTDSDSEEDSSEEDSSEEDSDSEEEEESDVEEAGNDEDAEEDSKGAFGPKRTISDDSEGPFGPKRTISLSWAMNSIRSMNEDDSVTAGNEEAGNTPPPDTESPPQGKVNEEDIKNVTDGNEEAGNNPPPNTESPPQGEGKVPPPRTGKSHWDVVKGPRRPFGPKRTISWAMREVISMQEDLKNVGASSEKDKKTDSKAVQEDIHDSAEEEEEDTDSETEEEEDAESVAEEAGNIPPPDTTVETKSLNTDANTALPPRQSHAMAWAMAHINEMEEMEEDLRNISESSEEDTDSKAEAAGHTPPPRVEIDTNDAILSVMKSLDDIINTNVTEKDMEHMPLPLKQEEKPNKEEGTDTPPVAADTNDAMLLAMKSLDDILNITEIEEDLACQPTLQEQEEEPDGEEGTFTLMLTKFLTFVILSGSLFVFVFVLQIGGVVLSQLGLRPTGAGEGTETAAAGQTATHTQNVPGSKEKSKDPERNHSQNFLQYVMALLGLVLAYAASLLVVVYFVAQISVRMASPVPPVVIYQASPPLLPDYQDSPPLLPDL